MFRCLIVLLLLGQGWAAEGVEAPADAAVAKPIAAWDVVPFQILDRPFKAGVVAFHLRALQVDFQVKAEGQEQPLVAVTVAAPTRNEQTDVWEYWFELDPAQLPDGPLQLLATVRVDGAPPLPLDPLPLFANAKGTLALGRSVFADADTGDDTAPGSAEQPVKTLAAAVKAAGDGGCITLAKGLYVANQLGGGLGRKHWTTITAATGVKREEVEIAGGRPGTDKLRFRNVTLFSDPPNKNYNTVLAGENGKSIVWLDDCLVFCKKGRHAANSNTFGNGYRSFITGGITREMANGPGATLMRGHRIERITSDAFTSVRTAINSTVEDIDPADTGAHPDFCQSYVADTKTQFNTFILYNCRGLRCTSQGFFGHNLRDTAFVNCLFVKFPADSVLLSQYSGKLENVLFLHLTLPNQTWLWRGKGPETHGVEMRNSILASLNTLDAEYGAGIRSQRLHVIRERAGAGTGEEATKGDPAFADPATQDWRLKATSPAAGSALPLACVPADIDGRPWPEGKPNRGCYGTAP